MFLTSCEEQLNLSPISSIGDNGFYKNTDEVEGAVFAMYDGLQAAVLREFALTEMRSDNTGSKNGEGEWKQFETLSIQTTNGVLAGYYASMYNVVFRGNKVLAHLDVVGDETIRNQFEGEAKFIRAFGHFQLVKGFGNIPLIDSEVKPTEDKAVTRVDADKVLEFIAADLTRAIEVLPTRKETQEGRATKVAAQALLAKVKLTQKDYAAAQVLCEAILADADYKLAPTFNDVFYDELNSEIIFAIQYLNDNSVESQDFSYEFTNLGATAGVNYITANFTAAFDAADVQRQPVLFSPVNPREVGKFITSSSDNRFCGNDWIVLRLADVYLMHAEAILAGQSNTSNAAAIASVNAVRARVNLPAYTGSLTKQQLLDERRWELAFENHRFHDLIRFGEADNVLSALADELGFVYSPTKLLLPIPQKEIDISGGKLTQNPGY